MDLFAQLSKIDVEKRLVYGRLADASVDKADEAMDYAKSKPYFQKWSESIAKDTGGKSLGNLRAMHGKVAAGKFVEVNFDDTAQSIDVAAKVVDDNEWKKVLEGVYTGFSIGGSYIDRQVEKMADGREIRRYVADPNEGSLVDRPCNPNATFFDVIKADGVVEKMAFKPASDDDLVVKGSAEEITTLAKFMNEHDLSMADVLAKIAEVKPAVVVKVAEAPTLDTPEVIRAAWIAIHKADPTTADLGKLKTDTAAAWVEKIDKAGPPAADNADAMAKLELTVMADLRKAVYAATPFAPVIASLAAVRANEAFKAYVGCGSRLATELDASLALVGAIVKGMIEADAANAGIEKIDEASDDGKLVAACDGLGKFEGDALVHLVKVGARNSAADQKRLQAIHDASSSLGAACPKGDPDMDGKAVKATELQKMVSDAVEPLQKALNAATEKITKLEAQPAPARISIRAVAKSLDADDAAVTKVTPITDDTGKVRETATLIKSIHAAGGTPLLHP